jgi:hypothetical protein
MPNENKKIAPEFRKLLFYLSSSDSIQPTFIQAFPTSLYELRRTQPAWQTTADKARGSQSFKSKAPECIFGSFAFIKNQIYNFAGIAGFGS